MGNVAIYLGGGIHNRGTVTLIGSRETDNTVQFGRSGGIWNDTEGTVTLDGTSSVTGNVPGDCGGNAAC